MRWLDRILCGMTSHEWRWPFRRGDKMHTMCSKCGALSRGVVVR